MTGSNLSDEEIARLCKKYALLNAISHDGKANAGSVVGRVLAENTELRKEAGRVKSIANQQVQGVNSFDISQQNRLLDSEFPNARDAETARKKEMSKVESEKLPSLPDLPKAKMNEVVTRFPPEPNGFMHIGHAKAAIIGYEYAKKYNGRFILRYDDTNPAAEKKEYYSAFKDAIDWLDIKPDVIKNASDDIEKFYDLVIELLSNSKAYVCTCTQEVMRENRSKGIECACRSRTTEDNLGLWEKMLRKQAQKSSATLRFLGDMQSLNTTMRDPVLFRVVKEPHPLKGEKYSLWPTYDFDGPVEDSLDGVTHAMRSKEYELRDELYYEILRALHLREPIIIEFSRLSLQNTTVSKRNLRKLIDEGNVGGWDDPRLPTIAGLRRRGFLPAAIREFILSMGVSKVESVPTWDLLESINRKLLDPVAKRYFFVPDPIKLTVEGAPKLEVRLKLHPEKDYGERMVHTDGSFYIPRSDASNFKEGSRFRLIEAYNVEVTSLTQDEIISKYSNDTSKSFAGVPKVQWVSSESCIDFEVQVPGALLVNDEYNPESMTYARGLAEESVGNLRVGEIIQLVRFGFCRIDSSGHGILAHK